MGDLFSLRKNNGKSTVAIVVIIVLLLLMAIGASEENDTNIAENSSLVNEENINLEDKNEEINNNIENTETNNNQEEFNINNEDEYIEKDKVSETNKIDLNKLKDESLATIPAYIGSPYYVINNNNPFFYDTDLVTTSYEKYSNLDNLRKMWRGNRLHRKRFNAN